jgi:hypothetical protein
MVVNVMQFYAWKMVFILFTRQRLTDKYVRVTVMVKLWWIKKIHFNQK